MCWGATSVGEAVMTDGQDRKVSGRAVAALVVLVLVAVAVAFAPEPTSAGPNQEPSPQQERDEVRQRQGEVAGEIDLLDAESERLMAELTALEARVADQEAEVAEAEAAADFAEADLRAAEEAVAEAEQRVAALDEALDELVVDTYVNPPVEGVFDVLVAENMSDAVVKQVLTDLQYESESEVLERFERAQEDLERERTARQEAADDAEAKRKSAAATLDDLEAARAELEAFATEAEAALERKLAEAAALEDYDRELSEQIQEAEGLNALADQLEGQGASSGGATITSSGDLTTVSCPSGGSITVASELAPHLRSLLDHAGRDGLAMCGSGYRDPQRQIELRRQNCGTSHYAIYEMPASQCSPPTARPGTSMHERGLAIDFTCNGGTISSQGSPCFAWLDRHATSYGLFNLPSEPWHWSTNGQ
jgi:septal ring factor EnvC (AmiA/AmiB activator)